MIDIRNRKKIQELKETIKEQRGEIRALKSMLGENLRDFMETKEGCGIINQRIEKHLDEVVPKIIEEFIGQHFKYSGNDIKNKYVSIKDFIEFANNVLNEYGYNVFDSWY